MHFSCERDRLGFSQIKLCEGRLSFGLRTSSHLGGSQAQSRTGFGASGCLSSASTAGESEFACTAALADRSAQLERGRVVVADTSPINHLESRLKAELLSLGAGGVSPGPARNPPPSSRKLRAPSKRRPPAFASFGKSTPRKRPVLDEDFLATLVHEFAHSHVNTLVAPFPELDNSGDEVYRPVAEATHAQAYADGHALACELLVRASAVRYTLAHDGAAEAQGDVDHEKGVSFVWTGERFGLLGRYEADREHFPTLEGFMPKLSAFFDGLAPRVSIGDPGLWMISFRHR
jgi:Domain of unknown function (DUF4932)